MTQPRARHPRAALAIGAAVLAGWLAVIVLAIATDASTDVETGATPNTPAAERPVPRGEPSGPGYLVESVD